jgi:putative methionine-R-sulfoxide reductase with GAF domain
VAWLRPGADDQERIGFFLGDNAPTDFATAHHPFSLGEGLAGSVWQDGQAASHSATQPHPKWKVRIDCKNESYVCVPVGRPTGPGGVFGFGSDQGFETSPEQVSVMETFAAVLGAAVPPGGLVEPAGRGRRRRDR